MHMQGEEGRIPTCAKRYIMITEYQVRRSMYLGSFTRDRMIFTEIISKHSSSVPFSRLAA